MNDDDVREWYLQAMALAEGDAEHPVGDIISDWQATLHPMRTSGSDAEPLPEDLGALFTVRWWRTRPSTVPSDDTPDMVFGPTSGGFAMRTKAGRTVRDRDAARPLPRRAGGLIADLSGLMASSRRLDSGGRGTDKVNAIRALAYLSLRLRGMTKVEAAKRLYEFRGWTRKTDGPLDRDQLRWMFQGAERTLRKIGLSGQYLHTL